VNEGAPTNGSGPPAGERAGETLRLGGMALRNGLLIHGPTSWAAAARTRDGEIAVASGHKPTLARGRLGEIPLLRGPIRLAEAMAVIPLARSRLPSARLPFEDPRVAVAALLATAASASLRRGAGEADSGGSAARTALRELAVSVLGVLPALTALRDTDLAAYHGVEHKAIGGYEAGVAPEGVPKEHERCGSNLIGPMLLASVGGQVMLERLLEHPGPLARGSAAVLGMGVAVEAFAYAERNPESALGRAVHGPGHEIQRLVSTREPTSEQLAVGVAALEEVLRAEGAVR
jgi:uncharacterized protein YqhQ